MKICHILLVVVIPDSDSDLFQTQKINMMPSSNLCDFWWMHEMYASGYFRGISY